MSKLSIVVPCYNEEESIPLFYPAVEKVVRQMNDLQIEYWFVNDGSSDNSLVEMRKLHEQNPERVHYVSFSRNFGKEAGLYNGPTLINATERYTFEIPDRPVDGKQLGQVIYKTRQNFCHKCMNCSKRANMIVSERVVSIVLAKPNLSRF